MSSYKYEIKTIDTHTVGEATRIIVDGFPKIVGETMMEKKNFVKENYDHLRKLLINEPRGHKNMFGSILVEPINKQCDIGVIFMDSGSYLNMCGHGTIGTADM
ncbi:proline racemase family protein [Lysinibacillus xylanilyticus]|uniref:proline racemase family protein n=1 Tax=Lysinibacillus xylanilyticus TaxID=582475 RepID=UPI0037F48641